MFFPLAGCNFRLLKIRNCNDRPYILTRGLSIFRLIFGLKYLGTILDETGRDENGCPSANLYFSPVPRALMPTRLEMESSPRSSVIGGITASAASTKKTTFNCPIPIETSSSYAALLTPTVTTI